jgi:hypothetical protein
MMVRVPSNGDITRLAKKGSTHLLEVFTSGTGLLAKQTAATQICAFWRKCSIGLKPRAFTVIWAKRHAAAPD